jgi:hypothetical protein
MFEAFKQVSLAAKVFTFSGFAMLLSLGLCGTAVANAVPNTILGYFFGAGVILLMVGVLGIIVGTLIAIIQSLRG